MNKKIICYGEIVWDALPRSLYLGGAPLNVAAHLAKLNVPVSMVSRIGEDVLGEEVIRNMVNEGLDISLIQRDPELNTGFVQVEMNKEMPSYEIVSPSAWDHIVYSDDLQNVVDESYALVYGTLSQRSRSSRETLQKLWQTPCLKILDVNLRPPYVDKEHVSASLQAANIVKLNEDEFAQIQTWFELADQTEPAVRELAVQFSCDTVCLTMGAEGSLLLHEDIITQQPGIEVTPVDTIGAGDSFLAALISGLMEGKTGQQAMEQADKLAAYVATQSGAVPDYNPDKIFRMDKIN